MSFIPTVERHRPDPPAGLRHSVDQLVVKLRRECPQLALDEQFIPLVPQELTDAPTLQLDDLSDISLLDSGSDVRFMQDRARLRAGDGDFVASCSPSVAGFESYCRDFLGLGSPVWLRPHPTDPTHVAAACLEDRRVRRKLIHELRRGGLLHVHPHMGTFSVWELAAMLHQSSRRSVKVIAPPPALTKWVNDKIAFADTVTRLFGPAFVPRTLHAANFAILARRVAELADGSHVIVLKLRDSAGGGGNVVADALQFRGRSLQSIRDNLRELLVRLAWDGTSELLVGSWETDVLCAPSAQLWVPPEPAGPPIVEGLFEQDIEGQEGVFVGSRPARFSDNLQQEIVDRCWLLSRLYQRLGYVGRCSLDMLLVGTSPEQSRLEFIECNGRWGGTSIPMTLMNRLFGDWSTKPYAARQCHVKGLDRLEFRELLECVQQQLYDTRTGRGTMILYNPGRMPAQSGINVIALGETWEEADEIAERQFPETLRQVVLEHTGG